MPAYDSSSAPIKEQETQSAKRSYTKLIWALIAIYAFMIVFIRFSADPLIGGIEAVVETVILFLLAGLHGIERYGLRNTTVFFLITWIVSYSFEISSVQTGLPFGLHYHYAMPSAISIAGVPLIVIFGYFSTGYFAWMLAHVFTGQYNARLKGKWIVVVPLIASFLMVMWDVGMDPVSSTVFSEYVWDITGPYFGVPIMNFVAWFVEVFIFYQLFALFLSKYDKINPLTAHTTSKLYWIEAVVVYGLIGLTIVVIPLSVNNDITQSMALVTTFTMIFIAIISFITVFNNKELC
ncbi:MAG: carotenoid biosynthesis protein [Halobacteriota archaeon]